MAVKTGYETFEELGVIVKSASFDGTLTTFTDDTLTKFDDDALPNQDDVLTQVEYHILGEFVYALPNVNAR